LTVSFVDVEMVDVSPVGRDEFLIRTCMVVEEVLWMLLLLWDVCGESGLDCDKGDDEDSSLLLSVFAILVDLFQ